MNAQRCRLRGEECLKLAMHSDDPRLIRMFENLAKNWFRIASQLEQNISAEWDSVEYSRVVADLNTMN